jgi:hypothetical protein
MNSQRSPGREQHDRSTCLSDQENIRLIQSIEKENGVVSPTSTIKSYFQFQSNNIFKPCTFQRKMFTNKKDPSYSDRSTLAILQA